jgi:hypothetical protein
MRMIAALGQFGCEHSNVGCLREVGSVHPRRDAVFLGKLLRESAERCFGTSDQDEVIPLPRVSTRKLGPDPGTGSGDDGDWT